MYFTNGRWLYMTMYYTRSVVGIRCVSTPIKGPGDWRSRVLSFTVFTVTHCVARRPRYVPCV